MCQKSDVYLLSVTTVDQTSLTRTFQINNAAIYFQSVLETYKICPTKTWALDNNSACAGMEHKPGGYETQAGNYRISNLISHIESILHQYTSPWQPPQVIHTSKPHQVAVECDPGFQQTSRDECVSDIDVQYEANCTEGAEGHNQSQPECAHPHFEVSLFWECTPTVYLHTSRLCDTTVDCVYGSDETCTYLDTGEITTPIYTPNPPTITSLVQHNQPEVCCPSWNPRGYVTNDVSNYSDLSNSSDVSNSKYTPVELACQGEEMTPPERFPVEAMCVYDTDQHGQMKWVTYKYKQ